MARFSTEHYPLQQTKRGKWHFDSYLICPECGQIDDVESDLFDSKERAVEFRTKMTVDVAAGLESDFFGEVVHSCEDFWFVEPSDRPRIELTAEDIAILEE